jgi:hypothetical protein
MEVSRPIIGGTVTCISQEDVSATIALRSSDDG